MAKVGSLVKDDMSVREKISYYKFLCGQGEEPKPDLIVQKRQSIKLAK